MDSILRDMQGVGVLGFCRASRFWGRARMKKQVIRTTTHRQSANAGKQARLRAFIRDYRRAAVSIGGLQQRVWNETGSIPAIYGSTSENARMGGSPAQMVARLVRGSLNSYWANRRNDFKLAVSHSSLPRPVKHQLNRGGRIFHGEPHVDPGIRDLARSTWRGVRKRHRLPDLGNLSPFVDRRCGIIERKAKATRFEFWVHFRLPRHGNFRIPVQDHAGRQRRKAPMARTLQLVTDAGGAISVRFFSDETANAAATRRAYRPRTQAIGVDFGLSAMFATSEGDLLGRKWYDELRKRDENLLQIAREVQKAGGKLN
jgi:putative transposase